MSDYDNMDELVQQQLDAAPPMKDISNVELNKAIEEAGMIETVATQEDPTDNPKVNEAAKVFMNSLPRVKALASNMKAGALGRVFKGVIEFPLGEGYPR